MSDISTPAPRFFNEAAAQGNARGLHDLVPKSKDAALGPLWRRSSNATCRSRVPWITAPTSAGALAYSVRIDPQAPRLIVARG